MSRQVFSPALKQILRQASKLRDWTRASTFEAEAVRRPEGGDQCRNDLNRRIDYIVKTHRHIDRFFDNLGFPSLSEDNRMVRSWDRRLGDLRRRANKGRSSKAPKNYKKSHKG